MEGFRNNAFGRSGPTYHRPVVTRANEGGFALLTVLLVLIGLTAVASAGFILSDSDYRVSQNHRSSVEAFLAANAGLYEYLGTPYSGAVARKYSFSSGETSVDSEKLLDVGDGRVLYRVESQAEYKPPEGGTATRRVSTLVLYSDGDIDAPAAIASVPGLQKNGGSGTISGYDAADEDDCEPAVDDPVAGVLVPPDGYEQNGGSPVPEGAPDQLEMEEEPLIDFVDIPWEAIVNEDGLYPDFRIPDDSWPSFGTLPPEAFPLIFVEGSRSVNPANSGRGTLIVTDDLTMNGSFSWEGVILTGGVLTSDGKNDVEGAVLAGLNVILGETIDESVVAHGDKSFQYNSCYVLAASEQGFGGFHELPGTWNESM